ncbi:MFS transporter [Williamsia phyllosphaerae]|uniref:Transporter n=1 Tax=Williamsia phyllosphaerae TaxID=885042 RepID=A0ABQ1UE00_9NOCA|nr:MFS transporter [Williamsia phyllosphaerae]GGF15787.1 putative transporter [Williamsia phyllosphaerae]
MTATASTYEATGNGALAPTGHQAGSVPFRKATIALFAAGMAAFMAMYHVQAMLPVFSDHFGVSPTTSALTVSLTTGMLALAIIPASVLSERYGRIRVMVISAIAASVLGLLLPWSPSIEILLGGRALVGILCAGVPAVAMAYLAEEIDGPSLGKAMGYYVSGTTIGGLTGRLVPGLAADVVDWRWALEIACLVSLAFALVFIKLVPASKNFAPQRVTIRTTLSNLSGHLRDTPMLCLFGLAFVLMGGFVTVYNFLAYRLLDSPFSLPQSIVSLVFLMYLAGTFSSTYAGRMSDRHGRGRVLGVSIAVMAAGLVVTVPDFLPSTLVGVFFFTAGFFGAHSVASSWVGARASDHRAEASSLYLFGYYLGSSVAGALGGIAFSAFGWVGVAAYVGVLMVIGAVLAGLVISNVAREPVESVA